MVHYQNGDGALPFYCQLGMRAGHARRHGAAHGSVPDVEARQRRHAATLLQLQLDQSLDKVRDRVPDMFILHGGDSKGVDRLAASWAERHNVQQLVFNLDRRLGARAGFKRNEQMLKMDPRYVIAFPGNGVLERLVIEAKSRRVSVVDHRGPLGTNPRER